MNQQLSKILICNEVHYKLQEMLNLKALYEFWMDGEKYSLFMGKLKGLPDNDDEIDELINAFKLEVDNNFWNNSLKKQQQYIHHLFVIYQAKYDWHIEYDNLCISAVHWCLEYQVILFKEIENNPRFADGPIYSNSWDCIKHIHGITRNYFGAKRLLKGCRSIVEEYLLKVIRTQHDDNHKAILPAPTLSLPTSTDQEPEPTEPDKGLSALQQLLFVRLLQRSDLFPKKLGNTDDAPELRAIALLTGLDYMNDIKGGKGANAKVNQLLNSIERQQITLQQLPHKFADLDAVENVARLLNVEPVVLAIQSIRADLEKLRDS